MKELSETYDRYGVMLYRLCVVILANKEDAEDAVHETFLKYLGKAPVFESDEHEKAWLIRVASNTAKDSIRSRKMRTALNIDEISELIGGPSPEDSQQEILSQIMNLPAKYRVALHLHYFEGYKIEEIAIMLNTSVGSVTMRLKRGREKLRLELEDEYENIRIHQHC
jgi:RNA polymerase sigma-70 factor (ECF subfamily)